MGLPDFRTSAEFWLELNRPEITRYEDFSDNKWFETNPEFAWGLNYYQLAMYRSAKIHDGYLALLRIAELKNGNYFCFTSNIDGVFQRTGFDPNRIKECHGNIHRLQCTSYNCKDEFGDRDAWEAEVQLRYDDELFIAFAPLPICNKCGALARPNVWFCKDTQYVVWNKSCEVSRAYYDWVDELKQQGKSVTVIECGAGLVIPTARIEAEDIASTLNGCLIRINPVDHMVPVDDDSISCAIGIPLGMSEALSNILSILEKLSNNK